MHYVSPGALSVSPEAGGQHPWDSGHPLYPNRASLAAVRGPQRAQHRALQCLPEQQFTAPSQAPRGSMRPEPGGSPTFLAAGPRVPGAAPPLPGGHCLVHHLVCGSHHGSVAERMPTGPSAVSPPVWPPGSSVPPQAPLEPLSCILGFNPSIPSQPSSLGDLDTNWTGSPCTWSRLSLAVNAP